MPQEFGISQAYRTARSQKELQQVMARTAKQAGSLTTATTKMGKSFDFSSGGAARGAITMENFGAYVSAATKKVLVWQMAIMAVYTGIRAIGTAIQTWRDLEVTLARISITTGSVGQELYKYFQDVAKVAIEFGMPIEQTLQGMDLALRATAKFSDATERAAYATQLLRSASVLANITGMQYSQAIDILVGSLRQSGMEMNEGI